MEALQINPEYQIADEQALRALYEPTHALAAAKCQDRLGDHAREFIRRSPFLCIGTGHGEGKADVSPRGDPPGFVHVIDDRTLAIPDRPGNNRLDTLANIIASPSVGLLFLIPGFDDTLRVNGTAVLSRDPALLATMTVAGRAPKLAIVVSVGEVFLHCAKALRRSRLWSAQSLQNRAEMPSLMKMILDETTGAPADRNEMQKLDEGLDEAYRTSMY